MNGPEMVSALETTGWDCFNATNFVCLDMIISCTAYMDVSWSRSILVVLDPLGKLILEYIFVHFILLCEYVCVLYLYECVWNECV